VKTTLKLAYGDGNSRESLLQLDWYLLHNHSRFPQVSSVFCVLSCARLRVDAHNEWSGNQFHRSGLSQRMRKSVDAAAEDGAYDDLVDFDDRREIR